MSMNILERHVAIAERSAPSSYTQQTPPPRRGTLVLEDGTQFEGTSFGYDGATTGEVVFCTGMVGYPEALTDASFAGQILAMTYPILGNYGVPEQTWWEDDRMHGAVLVVSSYIDTPSQVQS